MSELGRSRCWSFSPALSVHLGMEDHQEEIRGWVMMVCLIVPELTAVFVLDLRVVLLVVLLRLAGFTRTRTSLSARLLRYLDVPHCRTGSAAP